MNFLARVKLSNDYDLILNNLIRPTGSAPITDVDGTTALLLDDGTSWEYLDGEWKRIDEATDLIILNSFYPFVTSVCNSIQNDFVKCQLSAVYENITLSKVDDTIVLSGLTIAPKVQAGDFVIIRNYTGSNLTTVLETTDTSIIVDATGTNIRVTGSAETVGVLFASFPPDFLDSTINMLGYDMFKRENKEKRQERLGNYTYTNFEPNQYYGIGSYPTSLEDKVKFWQYVHT